MGGIASPQQATEEGGDEEEDEEKEDEEEDDKEDDKEDEEDEVEDQDPENKEESGRPDSTFGRRTYTPIKQACACVRVCVCMCVCVCVCVFEREGWGGWERERIAPWTHGRKIQQISYFDTTLSLNHLTPRGHSRPKPSTLKPRPFTLNPQT